MTRCLVYGYGNPGRQDDGLGIMLVEQWENWAKTHGITHLDFEYNYQLNIEDAYLIQNYEKVVFVDATVAEIDHIKLERVVPTDKTEFTMHAMYPGFILHLCESLYSKSPETFLLSIKGYEFELGGEVTESAQVNLEMGLHLAFEVLSVTDISELQLCLSD
jgi:hydrogenase maturation protease